MTSVYSIIAITLTGLCKTASLRWCVYYMVTYLHWIISADDNQSRASLIVL